jgi:hypothetical protein
MLVWVYTIQTTAESEIYFSICSDNSADLKDEKNISTGTALPHSIE